MKSNAILWAVAVTATVTALLIQRTNSATGRDGDPHQGIPPETVADYIHAVIQADRTIYTTLIVERMQTRGIVVASENWEQRGTLPLPVQFLDEAAHAVALAQPGVRFRLISLWPINERNKPRTEYERTGLNEILTGENNRYTALTAEGQARYFHAVYADKAVSQSCVGCHNAHPRSPRKNFKVNDVMGGLVITIPLGASQGVP